ncbi:MAG: GAF domain-containing protein [Candidatus Marinimicrobia bacterium]|nr:GAF domain-containing protein [Candidatus Neomarinimicrobiota bacterium]MBL7123029.1 GAF domain-containing protein [Candidatus Neomarinimicrobiota bacterium]
MKLSQQIYIPVLIFITVLVGGRLGISYVSNQESEKLEIKTQVTAEQVGMRLNDFLNTRITRLDVFRERLEQKPFLSEAEFRTTALRIQHELPGFQAVNWIDENGIIQWVTPLAPNLPVVGVDLVQKAAKDAAEVFTRSLQYQIDTATPLIKLVQGGNGFATYLPIVVDDQITGFVNGVFRIEELVSQCFNNSIKDFNYEVILSGKRVYLRGEQKNFENPRTIGRHNFTMLGQSWELQIVPGSSKDDTASFMRVVSTVIAFFLATLFAGLALIRIKSNAELAKAHKEIENSEVKFRTIFDKSPACLLRYSPNAEITDWNLEAASLFGLEFPPQKRRSIYDLEEMKPIIPAIEETFIGKHSSYLGSLEIQGKNIEVDANFETLVSGDDQIQGGIILLKDVTEQNKTMRAKGVMYEIGELANKLKDLPLLFQAIQNSLSGILDTRNFYVALYNEERDEFSYPYYQDEFDSAPPDPVKAERGISAWVIKSGHPILLAKEEFYTMNKEGKIDLLGTPSEQWLGCPLIVEDRPIGIMAVQSYSKAVVYDNNDMEMLNFVSDQIALTIKINIEDEKLRESEAMHRELSNQLSDSNNIKALLLDVISHDLKNPAGVISGIAGMLTMNEEVSDEIQLIKDSSDVLLKVLDNTTALARITLGESINMLEVNISDLVNDVIDEYKPSFKGEGNPLQINVETNIIQTANPIIAEVFQNYLSNALKYAPSGESVEVILKKDSEHIEFSVSDVGNTITGEDRDSIFQRSIQLANGKMRGSGLGLAIVKRIADVHGATVGVKPNQPTGNTFYLHIPLVVKQS